MNIYLGRILFNLLLINFAFSAICVHDTFGDQFGKELEIHSGAMLVTVTGFIMTIDHERSILVVKEKQIHVGQYRLKGRIGTTRMKSLKGDSADLKNFEVGQWIAVRGYAVSRARVYACSVKAKPGFLSKDHCKIEQLKGAP